MKPLILITNDDSVNAPGLKKLIECAVPFGDVVAVSPLMPHSGQSSAITVDQPLRISQCPDFEDARIFSVNGTPVDCVKLAMHAIVPRKPDLLLSGINHGSNSGNAITYSGTMGAVLEGCAIGIPSVGFSLCHHSIKADFDRSTDYIKSIVSRVLAKGLPSGIALNVNIPAKVRPIGTRVCKAAKGHWSEEYVRYLDPQGRPFYMLTGRFINEEPQATDTDEYWLSKNYISIVPVTPDQTAYACIEPLTPIFNI